MCCSLFQPVSSKIVVGPEETVSLLHGLLVSAPSVSACSSLPLIFDSLVLSSILYVMKALPCLEVLREHNYRGVKSLFESWKMKPLLEMFIQELWKGNIMVPNALSARRARIPWFRVHVPLLNDPGRLLSAHLMHTALLAGWAGGMLLYELLILDSSDAVFSPSWRQGAFLLPFTTRLEKASVSCYAAAAALLAHLALSGLFALASAWHWAFWDLDVFLSCGRPQLSFFRVFGIHLTLAGALCFAFASYHLAAVGCWTSDAFGTFGAVRPCQPSFSLASAGLLGYGSIAAHHLAAGALLAAAGCWHGCSWSGGRAFAALAAGNIEALLSTGLAAVFFSGGSTVATMWYGGSLAPAELYGPTRFSWDSGAYAGESLFRSSLFSWDGLTEALILFDSIGVNPAKGGLFRAGPMIKGDGVIASWAGHASFRAEAYGRLSVRRMPAFFETFPVILTDARGRARAVIPFRRAESRYSLAGTAVPYVRLAFSGGVFSGRYLQSAALVKAFARKALLGEILSFDRSATAPDGAFRAGVRGWFAYSHALLVLSFIFGHFWHAGRALFRDVWTGVQAGSSLVEYGMYEKLQAHQ